MSKLNDFILENNELFHEVLHVICVFMLVGKTLHVKRRGHAQEHTHGENVNIMSEPIA